MMIRIAIAVVSARFIKLASVPARPVTKHLAAITTGIGPEISCARSAFFRPCHHAARLKLSARLFVRPGELRQAEWAELDFDRSVWNIPAEKMKMRRPHRVHKRRRKAALTRRQAAAQQLVLHARAAWAGLVSTCLASLHGVEGGFLVLAHERELAHSN
jgi:hypothetical protein